MGVRILFVFLCITIVLAQKKTTGPSPYPANCPSDNSQGAAGSALHTTQPGWGVGESQSKNGVNGNIYASADLV